MATSMAAIKLGIAANLRAAFPKMQVSTELLTNPQPPCFDMIPGDPAWEYDKAMGRGSDCVYMVVRLMVQWNEPVMAQKKLDAFCDPTGTSSVKTAIEKPDGVNGQATLGGACAWARVTRCTGYNQYPHRQAQLGEVGEKIGVEFDVEIMT